MFYSDAKQDLFAYNILGKKPNGTFIDIGSAHAIGSNNTYALEQRGWSGVCVEYQSVYNGSYSSRKCKYINGNAFDINYIELFKELNFPQSIDYLSLDIDELSLDLLNKLPLDLYRFKVITIEHDTYLRDPMYRIKQRDILSSYNYYLVCANVFVEPAGQTPNAPFEDWWVDPVYFDNQILDKIKCSNTYPTDIINKF